MNTKSNIILQFKKLKEHIEPLIKYDKESSRNGFNPSKMKKLFQH